MDGRVKTLHPGCTAAYWRSAAMPSTPMRCARIAFAPSIFWSSISIRSKRPWRAAAILPDCIENIDIGGPAMIRAAAKNHNDVAVVVEPSDYAALLDELTMHNGMTAIELRRKLAAKAFARYRGL